MEQELRATWVAVEHATGGPGTLTKYLKYRDGWVLPGYFKSLGLSFASKMSLRNWAINSKCGIWIMEVDFTTVHANSRRIWVAGGSQTF